MIITDVKLTKNSKQVTLSARCKIRKFGWDTLYYSVDKAHADQITADASPFAASLLYPAMAQGEDLVIHGSLPQEVFDNMHTLMRAALDWDSKTFQPINITVDTLTKDTGKPNRTATFFTGGVDSFYTYLKYKNDPEVSKRVDDFILVRGFDIHPKNQTVWNMTLKNVKAIADAENKELIVVETNVHDLLQPIIIWEFNHGNAMAAIGLMLRKTHRLFYIPSSFTQKDQDRFYAKKMFTGSAVTLDRLWSTKRTAIRQDGADKTRLEKVTEQVAKSPIALKHLRVCYENFNDSYNCCVCDKCMRTMVNLYIAGVLADVKTFPKPLDYARITASMNRDDYIIGYNQENLDALRAKNLNPELQAAMSDGLARAELSPRAKHYKKFKQTVYHKPLKQVIYLDYVYGRSVLYGFSANVLGRYFF